MALKIFQAQATSRLGFVTDEIMRSKMEALRMIDNRAIQINATEAECIVNARDALENAVTYAGDSINQAVQEVFFYLNQIKEQEFYPLISTLMIESNEIQWTVLAELKRTNIVTDFPRFLSTLETDYDTLLFLMDNSLQNLEWEISFFNTELNGIKQTFFPQMNSFRDYFIFNANLIKEDMPNCNNDPMTTTA